jgi:hypothetical protein
VVNTGTDMFAVPVAWPTVSFSPIPLIAPPPFGREIEGRAIAAD